MSIYSIYRITNLINNKVYIGWTSRIPSLRFNQHKSCKTSAIGMAIQKYNKENFIFEIIYQSKDLEHSRFMESQFIKEYNSLAEESGGWGYNLHFGGNGNITSDSTKRKQSQSHKNKILSEEHKLKISQAGRKRTQSEESKLKLSQSRKRLISEGKITINAWNKDKELSEKHKESLKAAWVKRKLKFHG